MKAASIPTFPLCRAVIPQSPNLPVWRRSHDTMDGLRSHTGQNLPYISYEDADTHSFNTP